MKSIALKQKGKIRELAYNYILDNPILEIEHRDFLAHSKEYFKDNYKTLFLTDAEIVDILIDKIAIYNQQTLFN